MKPDEKSKPNSRSRRDFLKRAIIAAGYAIPTVMIFKMRSTNVWAQNYETQNAQQFGEDNGCKTVLEKIFKPQCW